MTQDWNPAAYLAFAQERARPAADLILRIPNRRPWRIVDLGCGPGNSTRLLHDAFPEAAIAGLDASPAMISKAREALPGIRFETVDVTAWAPVADTDLVFSNALFQWVPDHPKVILRIFKSLSPGAVLAIQMPDNLREPSHMAMAECAAEGPWGGRLQHATTSRSPLLDATGYYDLLAGEARAVDIWRTSYNHLLQGHAAIADMLSTTGLRPYLDVLDEIEQKVFLTQYIEKCRLSYRSTIDGKVLFPFPRLFIVAVRK